MVDIFVQIYYGKNMICLFPVYQNKPYYTGLLEINKTAPGIWEWEGGIPLTYNPWMAGKVDKWKSHTVGTIDSATDGLLTEQLPGTLRRSICEKSPPT